MNGQIITYCADFIKININDEPKLMEEVKSDVHDDKFYLFFHTGHHNFNFWWSKANDLQTDISYVYDLEKKLKININFIDLERIINSLIDFDSRYKVGMNVERNIEGIYQEFLHKIWKKFEEAENGN